jgi:hypothetical protein
MKEDEVFINVFLNSYSRYEIRCTLVLKMSLS